MSLQPAFRRFHEAIKLRRFNENAALVEKRNRVLVRLNEGLKQAFPNQQQRPKILPFNQGSYEMGTGVKPLDDDYDIDVGLVFDVNTARVGPLDVKLVHRRS